MLPSADQVNTLPAMSRW